MAQLRDRQIGYRSGSGGRTGGGPSGTAERQSGRQQVLTDRFLIDPELAGDGRTDRSSA